MIVKLLWQMIGKSLVYLVKTKTTSLAHLLLVFLRFLFSSVCLPVPVFFPFFVYLSFPTISIEVARFLGKKLETK